MWVLEVQMKVRKLERVKERNKIKQSQRTLRRLYKRKEK